MRVCAATGYQPSAIAGRITCCDADPRRRPAASCSSTANTRISRGRPRMAASPGPSMAMTRPIWSIHEPRYTADSTPSGTASSDAEGEAPRTQAGWSPAAARAPVSAPASASDRTGRNRPAAPSRRRSGTAPTAADRGRVPRVSASIGRLRRIHRQQQHDRVARQARDHEDHHARAEDADQPLQQAAWRESLAQPAHLMRGGGRSWSYFFKPIFLERAPGARRRPGRNSILSRQASVTTGR